MGNNSLKENSFEIHLINTIRCILSDDIHKKKTITVLEGDDDYDAFKYMMKNLIVSNGKPSLINILEKFNGEKRVIGIMDKDYDNYDIPKYLYYDYCCMEMMIISNILIFDKVYKRKFKERLGKDGEKFRFELLKKLHYISIIRKLSSENKWSININDLKLEHIIKPNKVLTLDELIKNINFINPNNLIDLARKRMIDSYISLKLNTDELLEITNGHDFMKIFDLYYYKFTNSREYTYRSTKDMLDIFICTYNVDAFKKTKLYNALKTYEKLNNLNIVE